MQKSMKEIHILLMVDNFMEIHTNHRRRLTIRLKKRKFVKVRLVERAQQTPFGLRRPSLPHNFGYCLRIEKQKQMMRKFFSGKKGIAL